jgi:hypothetical protein
MRVRKAFLIAAVGTTLLAPTLVFTVTARGADDKVTSNPQMYSDRDRSKAMKSEEEKLEQTLKTGEEKSF